MTNTLSNRSPVSRGSIISRRFLLLVFMLPLSVGIAADVNTNGSPVSNAVLSLPAIFSDHMVLQREQPVRIWGSARPAEKISIAFHGQRFETTADTQGQWRITLPAPDAGGPFQMIVKGESTTITLNDVFVGEVWLAAGQSNMAFRFGFSDARDKADAVVALNDSNIRMYDVAKIVSRGKLLEQDDKVWMPVNRENVDDRSAVALYFGQAIHTEEGVAIGIINCSQGSSTIEAWMSEAAIEKAKTAGYKPMTPFDDIRRHYRNPSVLHQAMLSKIIPYGIRGVIWYQGESNANDAAAYQQLLPIMIENWREAWEQNDLPFLFAQLPSYEPPDDETGISWALFRAAQAEVDRTVPHTGMAVLIDLGEADNIHPADKKNVGDRLATLAKVQVYGESIAYSGPSIKRVEYRGESAIISYHHAGDGLVVKGDVITGFSVRGADGIWYVATAEIQGNEIIVGHAQAGEVLGIRFGWANAPDINLYNRKGYPAVPFSIEQ